MDAHEKMMLPLSPSGGKKFNNTDARHKLYRLVSHVFLLWGQIGFYLPWDTDFRLTQEAKSTVIVLCCFVLYWIGARFGLCVVLARALTVPVELDKTFKCYVWLFSASLTMLQPRSISIPRLIGNENHTNYRRMATLGGLLNHRSGVLVHSDMPCILKRRM